MYTQTASHDDHHTPTGWKRWAYSTNHKDIGTMYLIFAIVAGVIGTAFSVIMRMELMHPGDGILGGRLDVNTSGLLIFSNNGDLVQKLSHPSSVIKRDYLCRVFGNPTKSQIKKLLNGVEIDGKSSCFDEIIPMKKKTNAKNNWFKVSLHSGKNREVRKLWETESLQVSRLIRIGFGPIELPEDLKKGQYRSLEKNTVERVIKLTGMEG